MIINVRFFMMDDDYEIIECNEVEFLEAEGAISFERHTVRENGISQICLTKETL